MFYMGRIICYTLAIKENAYSDKGDLKEKKRMTVKTQSLSEGKGGTI